MATNLTTIRLWEAIRKEMEAYRRWTAELPWPRFLKPLPTIKLIEEIRNDSGKAMTIANHMAQALDQAGIKLNDDETFACMLCVVKKPNYLSDVTGIAPEVYVEDPNPEPWVVDPDPEPFAQNPTPEPAKWARGLTSKMSYEASGAEDFPFAELHASAWRAIRYNAVMHPAVMEKIAKQREEERIRY